MENDSSKFKMNSKNELEFLPQKLIETSNILVPSVLALKGKK